jgi:putative transcriptional regulator
MKRISPAKALRWKLGLTQQEFATRYHIPIGTLRDWEQHRSEPDAPARAYLKVIAADPDGVAEMVGREKEVNALSCLDGALLAMSGRRPVGKGLV